MIAQILVGSRKGAGHIVDIAALALVIKDAAHGELAIKNWHVQREIGGGIIAAPGREAVTRLSLAFKGVQLGFVGDIADRAGLGATAEQRALRAFQHFDAVHVHHIDVHIASRKLHGLLVLIDRDIREVGDRAAGLVAAEAVGKTAHDDLALAGAVVAIGDVGGVAQQAVERPEIVVIKRGPGEGLHGVGDFLHGFVTAVGRDNNRLNSGRCRIGCHILGRSRHAATGQRGNRARDQILGFHHYPRKKMRQDTFPVRACSCAHRCGHPRNAERLRAQNDASVMK